MTTHAKQLSAETLAQHNFQGGPTQRKDRMNSFVDKKSDNSGSQILPLGLFAGRKRNAVMKWKMSGKSGSVIGGGTSSSLTMPSGFVMENTYKMAPEDSAKFSAAKVKKIADDILNRRLEDVDYNSERCSALSRQLSDEIKIHVKALQFKRYKIVVNVLIGERLDQSLEYASKCLWSSDTDSYSSTTYHNETLFAIATVYGTYYE